MDQNFVTAIVVRKLQWCGDPAVKLRKMRLFVPQRSEGMDGRIDPCVNECGRACVLDCCKMASSIFFQKRTSWSPMRVGRRWCLYHEL